MSSHLTKYLLLNYLMDAFVVNDNNEVKLHLLIGNVRHHYDCHYHYYYDYEGIVVVSNKLFLPKRVKRRLVIDIAF